MESPAVSRSEGGGLQGGALVTLGLSTQPAVLCLVKALDNVFWSEDGFQFRFVVNGIKNT